MAVLKHIKSRNANYSDAIDYLLFSMMKIMGKRSLMNPADLSFGKSIISTDFYVHQNLLIKNVKSQIKNFIKIKRHLTLKAIIIL